MTKKPRKGKTFNLYAKIAEDVARHGRSIAGILPDEDGMGFAYTIGNQQAGFPELIVIGPFGEDAMRLLNWLSEIMVERKRAFTDGEKIKLRDDLEEILLKEASNAKVRAEYTVQAGQFYQNENYRVFQAVLPDKAGKYPDEPGCEEPYASVPLLYKGTLITSDLNTQLSKLIH